MTVRYPIEVGSYSSFTVTLAPKPALDEKRQQRTDRDTGEPIFDVQLVAVDGRQGGDIISVKFPGTPHPGLKPGVVVKVTGLSVMQWQNQVENRAGLSFRAEKVEPLPAAQAPKAGAA